MALRGSFADTEPEDLLQLLALGGKTGILAVTDGRRQASLVFSSGMIIDAWDGATRGAEVVYALLGERAGTFIFTPQEVAEERTIDRDVASLLLTGARDLDDLNLAHSLLSQPTARPRLVEGPELDLEPLGEKERAVVALIDGTRTVGEIASGSGLSMRRVYLSLGHLVERGVVELVTATDEGSPLASGYEGPADGGREPAGPALEAMAPTSGEIREIVAYLRGE